MTEIVAGSPDGGSFAYCDQVCAALARSAGGRLVRRDRAVATLRKARVRRGWLKLRACCGTACTFVGETCGTGGYTSAVINAAVGDASRARARAARMDAHCLRELWTNLFKSRPHPVCSGSSQTSSEPAPPLVLKWVLPKHALARPMRPPIALRAIRRAFQSKPPLPLTPGRRRPC